MTSLTAEAEHKLISAAHAVRKNAHAPYSKFHVGAALLTADGEVFCGCNVENASYGLTICAERVAACSAVAAGHTKFSAIAISLPGAQTPCGACRQFLAEFSSDLTVLLVDSDDPSVLKRTSIDQLLPAQFEFDGPAE